LQARFTGDVQRAATTLLKDFRLGMLGKICLEWPAEAETEEEAVEPENGNGTDTGAAGGDGGIGGICGNGGNGGYGASSAARRTMI